jgi:hypothetical protein
VGFPHSPQFSLHDFDPLSSVSHVFGELSVVTYLGKEMPVVEVGDLVAKSVEVCRASHKCASEPAWERLIWFVGVVVGKCIEISAEWGIRWSVAIGVPCDTSVVQLFDPLGWA